jgi:two-component sensor histidine kinase
MIPLKVSYFISIIISILLFSSELIIVKIAPYKYGTFSVWGSLYPIHIVNIIAVYILMLVLLIGAFRKSFSNVEKNRILYILVGAIITIFTTLCNFLPAMGIAIKAPGHIGTLIFQFTILLAVYRYRLMNFGNAISRTIFFIISWIIFGSLYALVFWVTGSKHSAGGTAIFILLVFAAQKIILPYLERLIYPLKADSRRLLEALDKSLTISEQPKDAAKSLVRTIHEATNVPATVVYLRSNEKETLEQISVAGNADNLFPMYIEETSYLCSDLTCRVREELRRDLVTEQWGNKGKEGLTKQISDMETAGIEAVVPIVADGVLYGILGFSKKRFGGVYDLDDLETFRLLAARTAVAIAIHISSIKIAKREHLAVVGEMTAMIAHEIKNPLGAIKAAAEQIGMQKNEKDVEKLSVMIREEVLRLDTTIKTYLAFARPVLIKPEEIDIVKLTVRCAELFRNEADESNFEICVKNENEKEIRIAIDPDAYRQLFFNLSKNSLEAKNNGKLIVSFFERERTVSVIFEDNCGGMSSEVVEKLFNPFYTTKTGGTGLGMAICKKIATAMDGKLYVNSIAGYGTKFTLELSLKKEKR